MSLKIVTAFIIIIFISTVPSCKKDEETAVAPTRETGTVTDIDGNVYKTVKIGNQWWMTENLQVKTYRNGVLVMNAQSNFDWLALDTLPGRCYYGVDGIDKGTGIIYNGYAVANPANLAPIGWHIPTDADWKQLEEYVGINQTAADKEGWRGTQEADKLKMASPEGWSPYESIWSTNESGFTAQAGSCRLFNGEFGDPGLKATGFWWTSSGNSNGDLYYRYMDYKSSQIFRSHQNKNYGFSVRCVKD